MKFIAFDPGKMTGVAMSSGGIPAAWQLPALEAVAFVDDKIDDDTLVVCESFVPRPGAKTWQPDALETIGALRYLTWTRGAAFELQSPAQAKGFATDYKLRRMGWYTASEGGHVNDALRHLLLAMVRHGLIIPETWT